MVSESDPILIGGTGGSGTRVYALLLEAGEVYMGPDRTRPEEPRGILPFTRSFTPRLIARTRSVTYRVDDVPESLWSEASGELRSFATHVRERCPPEFERWGWKHPRNLYLLPLFARLFPNFRFVHVVRDGRDMALAGTQGQLKKLGPWLLPGSTGLPVWTESVRLWSLVNIAVSDWCENNLGSRYVCSRFEDLCSHPREEVSRLFGGLDLAADEAMIESASHLVRVPESLGRWRQMEADKRHTINAIGEDGLRRFGYG